MTFVFVNGSYHGMVPFHGRITFLVPGHYINELAADLEMQGDSFEMFGHLSKAKFWWLNISKRSPWSIERADLVFVGFAYFS